MKADEKAGRAWVQALVPLVVVFGLLVLDLWSAGGGLSVSGVVSGMALMALLIGLIAWGVQPRLTATQQALQTGLLGMTEATVGVVLVFFMAAPLTILLPQPWVLELLGGERAADLLVVMFIGIGVLVAVRALQRASKQTEARALADRDAASARADLADSERQLAMAELQLLRAQVEPHFLWNTLGNVEYLTRKDPKAANEMVNHLIAYLKTKVSADGSELSTLNTEFDSIHAYLGLMKFRMGARLSLALDLPPDLAQQKFPALMLQTLVENAIKHGLEPKPGEAQLRISVHRSASNPAALCLEVEDNGVGLRPNSPTAGTKLGLRNVRERLQAIYGDEASLSVSSLSAGGVCARIEWPAAKEYQ